jgi:hypothetical protein
LVVALDKNFKLKIANPTAAREVLQNVNTIVAAIRQNAGVA